jgi:hypothetical protein
MPMAQLSLDTLTAYGGKPKDYYLLEYFRLYEKYWDEMVKNAGSDLTVDVSTGLLLGACPHKATRERLWEGYLKLKGERGALTASILTSGEFWDYLSTTLEFTEEAYAGA